MANTLTITEIAPELYQARDIVARELTGAINSVMINSGSEQASQFDTVQTHRTAQPTLNTSVTPAMTIPAADDQTVTGDSMTLNKVANVKIPITGETFKSLTNRGTAEQTRVDLFAQALRTIVNEVELNGVIAIRNAASRAVGTVGTVPFASDFKILPKVGQILKDNGTPDDGDRSLIMDTSAGANLRGLAMLNKVNEAGGSNLLRQGELLNLQGFSLKESAQVGLHTAGTGTGDTLSGTPAIGSRVLTLSSFSAGEYLPGDAISILDDPNVYIIESVADATNQVTINAPGLRVTGVNGKAITRLASHTAHLALHRLSTELAMRPMAVPPGGDAATDSLTVQDPRTGLVFEFAEYKGYKMSMFDITVVYGWKVWKPEFTARLVG
jgi:hypothetical protein